MVDPARDGGSTQGFASGDGRWASSRSCEGLHQRALDKFITLLKKVLLSRQSLCVGHVRTGDFFDEFGSLISNVREKPFRDSDSSGTTKKQILADFSAEIQKHEFQADYDRRSIHKLNGVNDRVSTRRNLSCSCRRRTTSTRSTTTS